MGEYNFGDYKIRDDDTSVAAIREEEKFFGFEESLPLSYGDDYFSLCDSIATDGDLREAFKFKYRWVSKNYIRKSLQIYDELGIGLHDVNLANKKVKSEKDFKDIDDDKLLELMASSNPSKIPFYVCGHEGEILLYWSDEDNDKVSPLIVFRRINLPLFGNKITACIYLHEIAHTQLMGVNWGMKSLLNEEVIPHFIDQIAAMKIDATGRVLHNIRNNNAAVLANKLEEIYHEPDLSFALRIHSDTFVQSVLEATNLANIYFEASSPVKKEMLGDVGKIFDGEMFTEEMLSKYESGIDAVFKDVKIFKKV